MSHPPTLQLEEVRRRYEAARRRRQREEPRLLASLRQLQEEELGAWRQLQEAEHAAGGLGQEAAAEGQAAEGTLAAE